MGESRRRFSCAHQFLPVVSWSLAILTCSFTFHTFRRVSIKLPADFSPNTPAESHDSNSSNALSSFFLVEHNAHVEYRKDRNRLENWNDAWFTTDSQVANDADTNGTILDFAIAGFPNCGTTPMVASLANIAPMPTKDVCTPLPQTIWYSYRNWPNKFPDAADGRNDTKLHRGVSCSSAIYNMKHWSQKLPKTTIIIGIQHPILWLQSMWNAQAQNSPTDSSNTTPYSLIQNCAKCNIYGCPRRMSFCMATARFHVTLARLGKTLMNKTERALLAPYDADGGGSIKSNSVRNPIFLYELKELNEEDLWEAMAQSLDFPNPIIPHDKYHIANNRDKTKGDTINKIDLCSPKYDNFRSAMMPYAYEMSRWICDYFVTSPDVVVANPARFCTIVRNYEHDPCGRLVRLKNSSYVVRGNLAPSNSTPTQSPTRKQNAVVEPLMGNNMTRWCKISKENTPSVEYKPYWFNHFPHAAELLLPCWSWFRSQNATSNCGFMLLDGYELGNNNTWQSQLVRYMGCYVRHSPLPRKDGSSHAVSSFVHAVGERRLRPRHGIRRYLDHPEDAHALRRLIISDEQIRKKKGNGLPLQIGLLQRRGTRVITNLDEIDAGLRQEFPEANVSQTYFDFDQIRDQAEWWATKDIIITSHGAAVTNALFITDGTIVLQVYPGLFFFPSLEPLVENSGGIALDWYGSRGNPVVDFAELKERFPSKKNQHQFGNSTPDANEIVGSIASTLGADFSTS